MKKKCKKKKSIFAITSGQEIDASGKTFSTG